MTHGLISRQIENLLQEGTQVVLVVRRNHKNYSIFSTRVQANGEVKLHRSGTWDPEGTSPPTPLSSFTPFGDLYRDFGGRELVVAANDNWPFFGVEEVEEVEGVEGVEGEEGGAKRLRPTSGIDVSIMEALKRSLNFTYRVVSPADGKWGGPQPDGTVTGIIGLVARREADIAICEITITGSRESVVDFTWPYYLESVTLVSRAPAPKQRTFAVLWPFTLEVWLCIIFSTLAVGPVMKGVLLAPPSPPGVSAPLPRPFPLHALSFNFFRNLVVQGNLLRVKGWPGRFVFFFWYLFCFYVYALYSGTLTAVLAVPAFERPINTLNDLSKAKENGYTIGTIQDSSLEFIFKEAKGGIYQEVWQLFDHEDRTRSFLTHPDLGFDKIQSEKFVFVNPELNSKIRAAQRGRDEFYFGRQTFYPQGYGIACYSGAPFLGVFNQMLGRMISAGLVNKWAQDEVQKVSRTSSTSRKGVAGGPSAITLEHLQAAFFILLIGFLVSLLALVVEIVAKKI
ncbi:glutamate receptor ionotropic, delta-2-like [Penaeus indicus]|uniref:glutamate receptor ionotropic, delta-2-like n=1 Tax=Penaeus indicus TaxID=29960 RepID=UPI00300C526C